VLRPGLDARRRGAERGTAPATGPILAVGHVEADDLLVGDGPDLAVVCSLAPPELAAGRARGFARGAVDGYGADVGAYGLHDLRAPVGLVKHPQARRPYHPKSMGRIGSGRAMAEMTSIPPEKLPGYLAYPHRHWYYVEARPGTEVEHLLHDILEAVLNRSLGQGAAVIEERAVIRLPTGERTQGVSFKAAH